jgi:hypothetical protein
LTKEEVIIVINKTYYSLRKKECELKAHYIFL